MGFISIPVMPTNEEKPEEVKHPDAE